MRLRILNEGYDFRTRLLFSIIRLFSRQPLPGAARLTFYQPDFYGTNSKALTHEAMRGPSARSVADRELMAAYVSTMNGCSCCVGAHTATATRASGNAALVAAVLADPDSAPLEAGLRATLRMLGKLTREGHLGVEDVRAVPDSVVSRQQVEDAIAIGYAFNATNRLANAFGFEIMSPQGFQAGAKYLLRRGYR